ncbi:MAG: PEGA domain-containing protein [Candidatus Eremiobacteraeota bacterium]|nr:PEGA domain-containing protein [Candidatus Eremiobacteraeota bacterium]
MNRKFPISIFILILSFVCLFSHSPARAQYKKAILVVGDHSNKTMTQRENALKNYLVHYRQKSGNDSSTLPVFVYDFNHPQVREYCKKQLGIHKSDLLFLGIVTARGNLPTKVHLKVADPKDLEKNARLVLEKFKSRVASGVIFVTSDPPGAKVWLEKTYKGKTPVKIRGVPKGDYTLTLVKAGFSKIRKSVYIKGNDVVNVRAAMSSTTGRLAVSSTPSEAQVYIDGAYKGKTPLTLKSISPGEHSVLMKKGDMKWEGSALVIKGKSSKVSGTLEKTAIAMVTPTPKTPTPAPTKIHIDYTPPTPGAGTEVVEAFIPKSQTNAIFQVTATNIEEVSSIKDYYKPKPGSKFVVVYLQQQNISNAVQIYTGKFSLVDQKNSSFEALDKLSNFWLVVLRPGGMNMGYLVYEIPEDSKPMSVVLHGMNMAPLSVSLK